MIVIKNEMPKNCIYDCHCIYEDYYMRDHCCFTGEPVSDCYHKRHKDCPIVCELPDDTVGIIGIQKGDTNGDVIKMLFPGAKMTYENIDWWCAPYNRGVNK